MIEQQFIEQIEILDYMQYSKDLIPGFQQAIGFYHHPIYKRNEAVILHKGIKDIKKISSNDVAISKEIHQLRNSKATYEWVDESLIPFEQHNINNIQKHVFDEFNHYILLLRIDSIADNLKDLIYIYFKPDASNFGLKSIDENLSTINKSIIASLVVNSFKIYHSQRERFLFENNLLRNDNLILGEQINKLQIEHKVSEQNNHKRISQYIINSLESACKRLNVHLQLSNEAIIYLNKYDGNIDTIKESANKTVSMAYRIQLTKEGGILKIKDFHLRAFFDNKDKEVQAISSGIEHIADSRYSRTIQLLNRLEIAAKRVQANGNILTGSAVGQAMEQPISAPAISDALRKHKKKIQSLCEEFPKEWITIRKSFKPIINVLTA